MGERRKLSDGAIAKAFRIRAAQPAGPTDEDFIGKLADRSRFDQLGRVAVRFGKESIGIVQGNLIREAVRGTASQDLQQPKDDLRAHIRGFDGLKRDFEAPIAEDEITHHRLRSIARHTLNIARSTAILRENTKSQLNS